MWVEELSLSAVHCCEEDLEACIWSRGLLRFPSPKMSGKFHSRRTSNWWKCLQILHFLAEDHLLSLQLPNFGHFMMFVDLAPISCWLHLLHFFRTLHHLLYLKLVWASPRVPHRPQYLCPPLPTTHLAAALTTSKNRPKRLLSCELMQNQQLKAAIRLRLVYHARMVEARASLPSSQYQLNSVAKTDQGELWISGTAPLVGRRLKVHLHLLVWIYYNIWKSITGQIACSKQWSMAPNISIRRMVAS